MTPTTATRVAELVAELLGAGSKRFTVDDALESAAAAVGCSVDEAYDAVCGHSDAAIACVRSGTLSSVRFDQLVGATLERDACDDPVAVLLCSEPGLSAGHSARFASHDSRTARSALATNTTHDTVSVLLGRDSEPVVRWNVARRDTVPLWLLSKFAFDAETSVRHAAVQHPRIPASVLDELANDPEDSIRLVVAQHPTTSRDTLERLCDDESAHVRKYALQALNP